MSEHYLQRLHAITTFAFDVDGVLTDGSVMLHPSGEMVRTMHARDGYALQQAIKKGYRIVIITGGHSDVVRSRLSGLGVEDIFMSSDDKYQVMEDYKADHKLSAEEILYMGDDIPDFEVMSNAGLAACPHDAATEIRGICHFISDKNGGKGCVRDIIERTMRLHGKWFDPTKENVNYNAYTW